MIGVVGLGTAGAAAALFLSRADHEVVLLERVEQPGPVGAGIMMQPSGLLVLERLECVAPILEHGAHVDALVSKTTRGRAVLDLQYGELAAGLFGVGLHRGVLFETLHRAVLESPIDLRCGVDAIALRPHAERWNVVDSRGRSHGPFDLVVVCDGARSHLRDTVISHTMSVRPYPWGALWFIGESKSESRELRQFVEGTQTMIGVLPTGRGPTGEAKLASLFFSVEVGRHGEAFVRGLDAWRREVRRVAPPSEELLDQIEDSRQLTLASYFDVSMPRWHGRRVVFLGDAAHATSPQLGQGCNLALCDAAALSDALETHDDIDEAITAYTQERRDHLAFYQLATRALTPFFQSNHAPLGLVRDWLMPLTTYIPFVRREMLRAMAGTKTGWLSGTRETRMPASCRSTD
jgi:2-polyprenyl-6-methoxyphenol hydroxylase-like FAD-dependent oxidoreductase